MKETEIYKVFKKYCNSKSYNTWQEVKIGNDRLDMVLQLKKDIFLAVEFKTSLNLDVIAQAIKNKNRRLFCASIIVVPEIKRCSKGRILAERIIKQLGLGLIYIQKKNGKLLINKEKHLFYIQPKIMKRYIPSERYRIENFLYPEQMKTIGGSTDGHYFTKWRQSIKNIETYLESHGEATTRELFEKVKTHFCSMDSLRLSLQKWVNTIVPYTYNKKLYWRLKKG